MPGGRIVAGLSVFLETPSNPLLRITDLRDAARCCRDTGALLVVDHTFLSPALQRPIELGADLVVHSTTKYLNGHSDVRYPGLPAHPGHAVAAGQQSGFGAVVSFELRGGEPAVRAFLDGLRWFTLAESLGGVDSLIAHPATMTHASMDAAARAAAGIRDFLLRLSVGIESARDLTEDLRDALDRAASVGTPRTGLTSAPRLQPSPA